MANAHDDVLLTVWQPWETAAPGQYLEVDFAHEPVALDEIRLSLVDSWSAKFQIQIKGVDGVSTPLPTTERAQVNLPFGDVGRMIAAGLHRHGVDYVLVLDSSVVAQEMARRPARFGCRLLAHQDGTAIYQVVP